MDQEILVVGQVEEAKDLVNRLIALGIDIKVAFWAKNSDGGSWTLYLGVNSLDRPALSLVFRAVATTLDEMRAQYINLVSLQLLTMNDPLAAKAIEIRKRLPAGTYRFPGRSIGDLQIDDAFFLPRMDGPLNRDEVVQAVFGLLRRSGLLLPSIVTLKDGSQIHAVPRGIQIASPGVFQITWHDVDSGEDRMISADEVVGIRYASSIAV